MDSLSIIVMLLALIALAGVVIYFIRDYLAYKDKTAGDIQSTNNTINQEEQDRLANLAYVVGQVNTVNDDIYNTMTSNISYTNSNVSLQTARTNSIVGNLGNIVTFDSAAAGTGAATAGATGAATGALSGSAPSVGLFDLPGSATPNINLIKHMTATMGLTANDLAKDKQVQFCSRANPAHCINFPDASGNTFITNLDPNGKVVLDGPVQLNSNVMSIGGANGPQLGVSSDSLNSLLLKSRRVGLGSTNPAATFHITQGNVADPMLQISANNAASTALLVDASGNLIINQAIQLKAGSATSPSITLQPATPASGTNTGGGVIISPTSDGTGLQVNGNMTVTGNLTVNGQSTLTGNVAATNNLTIGGTGFVGTKTIQAQ